MPEHCTCDHGDRYHDCFGEIDDMTGRYILECCASIDCGDFDGRCGCKFLGHPAES